MEITTCRSAEGDVISRSGDKKRSHLQGLLFEESVSPNSNCKGKKKRVMKPKTETNYLKKTKIDYECSICLSKIRAKKMANPSGCMHYFCVPCMKTWSKQNKNTCPLDRSEYSYTHILDRETLTVIMKINNNGKEIPTCTICKLEGMTNMLISCDWCMLKYHIGCLSSPDRVSVDSWVCQTCENLGIKYAGKKFRGSVISKRRLALSHYKNTVLRAQPRGPANLSEELFNYMQQYNSGTAMTLLQSTSFLNKNKEKFTMLDVEKVARKFVMPYYTNKSITKEKFKAVVKDIVPMIFAEGRHGMNSDSLQQLVEERVMIIMDVL